MRREGFFQLHLFLILLAFALRGQTSFAETPENDSEIHVGFENQFYQQAINPNWFPFVNLGGSSTHHWEEYELNADLEIKIGLKNPKANSFTSQNAYIGEPDQSYESPLRFSYGRRHILWSEMDEMWNLGNIEPLDNWDPLRPRSQGLTGIFAYTETQRFNFRIFLSYIALPETDPNVVIDNNQFESVHPESVAAPPESIAFHNHQIPLAYNLDIPSLNQIIFRPSFAFMVESKPEIPFTGRLMYAYMPLNYFPLAFEAPLLLNAQPQNNHVAAEIHPRLVQHHLYSGDLGYRFNDHLKAGLSELIDQPDHEAAFPDDYTYTPLTNSFTTSPWIKYELPQFKLTLSQIWVNGGVSQDVGNNAIANQNLFSTHVFYRSASLLAAELHPQTLEHRTSFLFKYIHEYSIQADWLSLDILFKIQKHWSWLIGGDWLHSVKDASSDLGAEHLSDLRALDRIRVGVTYVF